MPNPQIERSTSTPKSVPLRQKRDWKKPRPCAAEPARTKSLKADEAASSARTTKQELVLTLLSRPQGASVADIMQETNWQMHSVRGFLAGTVKKKLGLALNSSKLKGGVRRYRIPRRPVT